MTSLFKEIEEQGYELKNDVMGLYEFRRQVGDNVVGFFETLIVDTRTENYTYFKYWGGSRKALPISFKTHIAITKFLNRIGQLRNEL